MVNNRSSKYRKQKLIDLRKGSVTFISVDKELNYPSKHLTKRSEQGDLNSQQFSQSTLPNHIGRTPTNICRAYAFSSAY